MPQVDFAVKLLKSVTGRNISKLARICAKEHNTDVIRL